jgi:hypothetical protein
LRITKLLTLALFLLFVTYFTTAAVSNIWTTGILAIGTTDDTEEVFVNGSFEQLPIAPEIIGSTSANDTYLNGIKSTFYSDGYVYAVGDVSDSLGIIDVTNPESPEVVGGVADTTYMSDPEHVVVAGKYAYVASSGLTTDAISVIDISDKSNPVIVNSYTTGNVNPEAMAISGSYLYFVERGADSLTIIDISDPKNLKEIGSITETGVDPAGSLNQPYSLAVHGGYAYVGTNLNESFSIINVSDPYNPTLLGSITDSNLDYISDIKIRGGYAYLSVYTSDRLTIINITDPTNPTIAGSAYDATYLNVAYGVQLAGDYAYVGSAGGDIITIVDISDPTSPSIVTYLNPTGSNMIDGFAINGNYLYMPDYADDTMHVVDLKGYTTHAASFGTLGATQLDVDNDLTVSNTLSAHSGVVAGPQGISTTGDLGVGGTAYGVAPRMYLTRHDTKRATMAATTIR